MIPSTFLPLGRSTLKGALVEFSASKNIKSMRALFQEDVTVDKNGMRHRSLSSGATAKELPKNAVGEEVEP